MKKHIAAFCLFSFLTPAVFAGDQVLDMSAADDSSIPVPKAQVVQGEQIKAGLPPEPVISGDADLSLFFRRLESVGMETKELRDVSSKIEVFFKAPDGVAEAQYSFILDNLYIPGTFRENGSNKIKFNLASNEISTIIHEYTHAANDVSASENAASGTPARVHYNSVKYIWADLYTDPDGSSRYARMRADEVSSYFMGEAIAKVFDAADEIIMYNKYYSGGEAKSVEEAKALGGKFFIPTEANAKHPWEKGFLFRYKNFGRNRVYDSASFKSTAITPSKLIHWKEEGREWLKDDMYRNILGLNPPKDVNELLERMNSLDNDWLRKAREEVAKIRLDNAQKTEKK